MRRSRIRAALLACTSLGLGTACGGGLPSPTRVDKLRLFAITTPTPEVRPAPVGGVTLRAEWFDGRSRLADAGPARPIHFLWRFCARIADDDPRACLMPDKGTDLKTALASTGGDRVTIDPARLVSDPPDADTTAHVVMLVMCPVEPPVYDAAAGQYVCPSEREIDNARREGIQAVRRIVVRRSGELNHNPGIATLKIGADEIRDGARVGGCDASDTRDCPRIAVVPTAGSDESVSASKRETLLASFFATAGSFDRPRAVASGDAGADLADELAASWRPPTQPGRVRLWVGLRDGRGGESVRSVEVEVTR